MHVHQMDVVLAYTQGDLHDEIYLEQPEGFEINTNQYKVCLLKKPLYGLKQAGREWYVKIDGFLQSIDMRKTEVDPCVYVSTSGKDSVIIVIYVDDMLIASKNLEVLCKIKV